MAKEQPKRGLGSGLGAIFGEAAQEDGIQMLPLRKVEPRQDQPRYTFREEGLQDLADSLRAHGMIQPITARRLESGYYQIIAGERRWRAAGWQAWRRSLSASSRRMTGRPWSWPWWKTSSGKI